MGPQNQDLGCWGTECGVDCDGDCEGLGNGEEMETQCWLGG